MVGEERPLVSEIFGQTYPVGAKKPIFSRYSLVAPQPWHLAKKVQLTLIGSPLNAFPMSLRWTVYVALAAKWGLNNAKRPVPSKIVIHLNKVCHKVSFCEYCQRQSCRAFTGLCIRGKLLAGDVSYYVKILLKLTHPFKNIVFQLYLAKTDPRSSRTVSSRQLSFLLKLVCIGASMTSLRHGQICCRLVDAPF